MIVGILGVLCVVLFKDLLAYVGLLSPRTYGVPWLDLRGRQVYIIECCVWCVCVNVWGSVTCVDL